MVVNISDVSPANPNRGWMEFVVEWNLIYRGRETMNALAPDDRGAFETQIKEDPTGVNLFLEIRKRPGPHDRRRQQGDAA